MTYTLQGRQLSRACKPGELVPEAPCIFCGEMARSVDDGGSAHVVGAMMERGPEWFLYHDYPPCEAYARATRENGLIVWCCGCETDYVENVGPFCHNQECGARREDCKEYPSIVICPSCFEGDMMASEAQTTLRLRCLSCGVVAHYADGMLVVLTV